MVLLFTKVSRYQERFIKRSRFLTHLWRNLALHNERACRLVDEQLIVTAEELLDSVVRRVQSHQIAETRQDLLQVLLQVRSEETKVNGSKWREGTSFEEETVEKQYIQVDWK